MLQQYEELAVLDQGEDGAIVSIRGQDGPSIVLGAGYLHHLDKVLAAAMCDIEVGATGQGVMDFTRFNRHLSRSKLNWRVRNEESAIPG